MEYFRQRYGWRNETIWIFRCSIGYANW
jgi:hypothetical protein